MGGAWPSRCGDDIATEIVMMRTTSKGPFVIVEGPTDERFLWPRLRKDCYVSIGSGRSTVENAVDRLDILAAGKKPDYVGVVDEDYDWLIGYSPASANVIKTDARDLEGILFRSRALQGVIAEYCDKASFQAFEAAVGMSFLDAVLQRAEPFGKIRMVNSAGPMADLKKFKPVRFHKAGWTYDIPAALDVAVTLGVAPSVGALSAAMAGLTPPDIWHCVRGHDLVDILHAGILHVGGVAPERLGIERMLRQGISVAEFQGSQLFQRLNAWGIANVPVL